MSILFQNNFTFFFFTNTSNRMYSETEENGLRWYTFQQKQIPVS